MFTLEQPLKATDVPTLQMQKMRHRKTGFPKHMQKHFLYQRGAVVLRV